MPLLFLHVILCFESLVLNFALARSQNTARRRPPSLCAFAEKFHFEGELE